MLAAAFNTHSHNGAATTGQTSTTTSTTPRHCSCTSSAFFLLDYHWPRCRLLLLRGHDIDNLASRHTRLLLNVGLVCGPRLLRHRLHLNAHMAGVLRRKIGVPINGWRRAWYNTGLGVMRDKIRLFLTHCIRRFIDGINIKYSRNRNRMSTKASICKARGNSG